MRRREFITLLGGATVWPLAARAQQPAMPVVGVLGSTSAHFKDAFVRGLSEAGYVEGQNVRVEYRWAAGAYDRLSAMADELVNLRVNVIATLGAAAALVAKAASTKVSPPIPIVFGTALDPAQFGLVASLSRPGGNITGVTTLNVEVGPKRLELLHEFVPAANVIGLLVNPNNPNAQTVSRDLQTAARKLGLQLRVLHAGNERDFDGVFVALVQLRAGALVIGTDAFFTSHSERLAALALRHAVPAIYQYPEFTAAGGLMSYGSSVMESFRIAGVYTGRILKGEKPADLPVQQITKVELIINLKTAKALGLTVPLPLLGRADEVIE
jgi:putative tryptophan/tyrosine transport system substrate-binding protein